MRRKAYKKRLSAPALEANNYGFNYRSGVFPGSGSLGTGRLVVPDWKEAAQEWLKAGSESKSDWEEFGKRIGLMPDGVAAGWDFLKKYSKDVNTTVPELDIKPMTGKPDSGPPVGKVLTKPYQDSPVADILSRVRFGEAVKALRGVLGEAASFWGYSIPGLNMLKTPTNPGPGLGFHTKTAEEVWRIAKQVADEDPKEDTSAIISKAIDRSKSMMTELTPEDMQLLNMAVNWHLAGKSAGMEQPAPITNNNRTGGMPGGPFRSSGQRGAP